MPTPKLPLANRRIAITRAREQASELAQKLNALGAEVVELPLIRISAEVDKQALADVMLEFGSYDWLVFTSANGVRFFFEQFFRLFDDIRALGLIRLAGVGDATVAAIAALHLKVECQPKIATAENLADELIGTGSLENAKVLVITGNLNRPIMMEKLQQAGAIVDLLQVYKTEATDLTGDPAVADFRRKGADAILFASSSAVEAYAAMRAQAPFSPGITAPMAGSIGPQTSETMTRLGITIGFCAKHPSLDELVAATVKALRG
ncbi:MAG: uroporphyrinogen-III synthase [Opitutae bacterium]|nr:uroporphyrinogen-III synthase [Opitutae bacterium]